MSIAKSNWIGLSRVPLRIGLAGGGSDLPSYSEIYGGRVVNFAINRVVMAGCWFTRPLRGVDESSSRFFSGDETVVGSNSIRPNRPISLAEGTLEWFRCSGKLGAETVVMRSESQVGAGSGLGLSSARVVSYVLALSALLGESLTRIEVARAAITIEREICGEPGGIQDYFPGISGGFRLIENSGFQEFSDTYLRVSPYMFRKLSENLFLVPLQARPRETNLIQDQIRSVGFSADSRHAVHSVKSLTHCATQALTGRNLKDVAEIFNQSWTAKTKFAQGTVTEEMEALRDFCMANGVLGVKVSGAGGGGHLVGIAKPAHRSTVIRSLKKIGVSAFGVRIARHGAISWRKRLSRAPEATFSRAVGNSLKL